MSQKHVDIPGYYYDAEKKKYFRILTRGCNASHPYFSKSIKHKLESDQEQYRIVKNQKTRSQRLYKDHLSIFPFLQYRLEQPTKCTIFKSMEVLNRLFIPVGTCEEKVSQFNNITDFLINEKRQILVSANKNGQILHNKFQYSKHNDINLIRVRLDNSFRQHIAAIRWHPNKIQNILLVAFSGVDTVKTRGIVLNNYDNDMFPYSIQFGKCLVWTCDWCPVNLNTACVGTSRGSFLVNLERKTTSLIKSYRTDIFSQAFSQNGDLLYNGSRTGLIFATDTRNSLASPPVQVFRQKSSVSSLIPLTDYTNDILAASVDGRIYRWDMRNPLQPVNSYEGNINVHTSVNLALNPSQSIVWAGGQDGRLRSWSVSSGELLYEGGILEEGPLKPKIISNSWLETDLLVAHGSKITCLSLREKGFS